MNPAPGSEEPAYSLYRYRCCSLVSITAELFRIGEKSREVRQGVYIIIMQSTIVVGEGRGLGNVGDLGMGIERYIPLSESRVIKITT